MVCFSTVSGKAPTKIPATVRLDPDLLDGLHASSKGWQARANQAPREWLEQRHGQ
jgi:uncharacterized protein (DUF4415 family)